MSSNPERLQYLFQRYLHDTGTPAEIREFWTLFSAVDDDDPVKRDLWRLWHETDVHAPKKDWEGVLQRIQQQAAGWEQSRPAETRGMPVWRRIAAAAAVLALLASGYWLLFNRTGDRQVIAGEQQRFKNDVPPGGNKAVLTLANGKTIVLDRAHKGELARQGSSSVMKVDSGRIAYSPQSAVGNLQLAVQYNTLSTPRGGQYQLVLPDGSKVWLNAASSIRFPTAFRGKNRTVEITGEAYFEIVKDAARPFFVKFSSRSGGGREGAIQVLGTHFNVNAYADEAAMKVTLLEGHVKVSRDKAAAMLRPGEQAVLPVIRGPSNGVILSPSNGVILSLSKDGPPITVIGDADVEEAVAWKNGVFRFNSTGLHEIMRQLSRWYDVEVRYKGNFTGEYFTGTISRDENVSKVLEMLELTKTIAFEVEDRKVTVLPVQ